MKKYIPAITGLRTFAVFPVIAHHLGIDLIPGGFLGVDVFFVISGFLISAIILFELENNTFSFTWFYRRRMLRLLPALLVVLVVSNLVGILFLTPEMVLDNVKASLASLFYVSNIYFWSGLNYFSTMVDYVPLVHLWTLSVEEQFYFLFPLSLIIFVRVPYRFRLILLGGICIVGVIGSIYLASFFPSASFYLLPTRMWEFMFGFYAATATRSFSKVNEIYSWISFAVLLLCFFFGSTELQNPGGQNLIVVIATAFLLFNFSNTTNIEVFLSANIFYYIGLLSYSLYLWHQPVLVFLRLQDMVSLTFVQFVFCGILITLLLSVVTFELIERPISKNRNTSTTALKTLTLLALACSVIVFYCAIVISTGGLTSRYSKDELALLNFENYQRAKPYREGECFLSPSQGPDHFSLDLCISESEVLIWGDSYAAALYSGSEIVFSTRPSQLTASSCPPLFDDIHLHSRCKKINNEVLEIISQKHFKKVILYANWLEHSDYTLEGLERTVFALKDLGVESVILVGPTPKFYPSLPYRLLSSNNDGTYIESSLKEVTERVDAQLFDFSLEHNLEYFSPLEHLCSRGRCHSSRLLVSKAPIIWDDGHLTFDGAALLLREMRERGLI